MASVSWAISKRAASSWKSRSLAGRPGPRNATLVALDPVATLAWLGAAFDELRLTHPAVDRRLVHALVTEVRRLSALLVEAHYVAADKRIYLRLADLSRIFSGAGDDG